MPSCLETFCSSGKEGAELQIAVDNAHPDFACECELCSPHSPEPVSNEETLAFLLVEPIHYDDQQGTVSPDAFIELTKRDLSLFRKSYSSADTVQTVRDKLIQRGADRRPPKLRAISEVCIIRALDIRQAEVNSKRVFAVYDTALEENTAHASVFTTKEVLEGSKLLRKQVRQKCHAILANQIVGIEDFLQELK